MGLINPILSLVPALLVIFYLGTKNHIIELFLFFLLILIFADNRAGLEAGMRVNRIVGVVIITFFTLTSSYFKNSSFLKNIYWLVPFWISLIISSFFSPSEIRIQVVLRTISYFLLPLTVFGLFTPFFQKHPRQLKKLIRLSIIVIISGFLLFLIAPHYVQSIGEDNQIRISGLLGNANGLAMFCSFISMIAWFTHKKLYLYSRNQYILLFFFFLLGILISGSRTSLGVFILFHGLVYINSRKRNSRYILKYLMIPIIIFGFTSFGISLIKKSNLLSSRVRFETLETFGGRLIGWDWGYQQVPKSFWFGKGLMYDSYIYQNSFSPKVRSIERGLNAAFSGVLALLLDAGVIGAFFFIIFFIGMFKQFKDKKILLPFILGFVLSFILESWIMASLQPFTILFYTIIGLFQFNIESKV